MVVKEVPGPERVVEKIVFRDRVVVKFKTKIKRVIKFKTKTVHKVKWRTRYIRSSIADVTTTWLARKEPMTRYLILFTASFTALVCAAVIMGAVKAQALCVSCTPPPIPCNASNYGQWKLHHSAMWRCALVPNGGKWVYRWKFQWLA